MPADISFSNYSCHLTALVRRELQLELQVNSGDFHCAWNRSSFSTYFRINGISNVLNVTRSPVKVIGIGTVELEGLCMADSPVSRTMILKNVLHVPVQWLECRAVWREWLVQSRRDTGVCRFREAFSSLWGS
jgi:hypothetical protein